MNSLTLAKLKGTYEDYLGHRRCWYKEKQYSMRLGQYVWNMMGEKEQSWPELYYCSNEADVHEMIFYHFYPLQPF